MRFVPGPDLPTGGKIVGLDGVRDAYRSGRGTFRTRATVRVENVTDRRYAGSVIVADGNRRFYEPAPGRNYLIGVEASLEF